MNFLRELVMVPLAALLFCLLLRPPASAADVPDLSECASHLWVTGGEHCTQWNDTATLGGGFKGLFPHYRIAGKTASAVYSITLIRAPIGRNSLQAISLEERSNFIRHIAGNGSTDFEPPTVSGDLTIQRLKVNKSSCFGFFRNGSLKEFGYAWQFYGIFCNKLRESDPLTDSQITDFISSIHIQD